MQSKRKALNFILICLIFVFMALSVPYSTMLLMENNIMLTQDEFNQLINKNPNLISGNCITAVNDGLNEELNQYVVKFKLFNLFNIKNVKVNVVNNNQVLVGGDSVGINLQSRGVVVVGSNYIITKNGNFNPATLAGLNVGDVVVSIDNKEINNINDITSILNNYDGNSLLKVKAIRQGEEFTTEIKPLLDIQTKSYKLGLWIRDDTMGVGTLTFINPNTLRFGALGHAIADADTKETFDVKSGQLYKCNVIGVKMGKRGIPGEIMGLFVPGRDEQGTIDKNNDNGVYGNMFENSDFLNDKKAMPIGGRLTAKPGKAKILTTIDGTKIESFDIEIIKTNYGSGVNSKSMVIRVTDEKLIQKTGGIVQGMSGSPIIQDGKIVGAVTHVFVNDPKKGFGLYLDWMLNE